MCGAVVWGAIAGPKKRNRLIFRPCIISETSSSFRMLLCPWLPFYRMRFGRGTTLHPGTEAPALCHGELEASLGRRTESREWCGRQLVPIEPDSAPRNQTFGAHPRADEEQLKEFACLSPQEHDIEAGCRPAEALWLAAAGHTTSRLEPAQFRGHYGATAPARKALGGESR